ncbi:MAG: DUF1624 domain-containing protein [Clostridiales bacterium]|jgi:uncharacterized membrane protein|nr:DUF1624 domain-containing protein [Clostridiales bacterium]
MKKSERLINKKLRLKNRVWEADFLRGICLILMMLYHLGILVSFFNEFFWFDYVPEGSGFSKFVAFAENSTFYSAFVEDYLHKIVIFFFFFLAGIATFFSRNTIKSFFKTAGFALAVTAATYGLSLLISDESFLVTHGVFHIFAFCYLFCTLASFAFKNKYARSGFFIFAAVFFIVLDIRAQSGAAVFPDSLWAGFFVDNDLLPSYLDNFYIIPYIGYFLIGAGLAPFLYPEKKSILPKLDKKWHTPVTLIGRHPVTAYALHLVVFSIILFIIGLIFVPNEWLDPLKSLFAEIFGTAA